MARERPEGLALLTPKEIEVLQCMADAGYDRRAIAEALGIGQMTVKHHQASIYFKLGVSGRPNPATRAVVLAWRAGLIR